MRENVVRELVQQRIIDVVHIEGKNNPSDIFTKEDKDVKHFTTIRDILVQPAPSYDTPTSNHSVKQSPLDTGTNTPSSPTTGSTPVEHSTSNSRAYGAKGGIEGLSVNPIHGTTRPQDVVTS